MKRDLQIQGQLLANLMQIKRIKGLQDNMTVVCKVLAYMQYSNIYGSLEGTSLFRNQKRKHHFFRSNIFSDPGVAQAKILTILEGVLIG